MAGFNFDTQTHCLHGHDLRLPDAIYVYPSSGSRTCAVCRRERDRRKKQTAAAGRLKTHCAKGHRLEPGDLVPSEKRGIKGKLTCRKCRAKREDPNAVDPLAQVHEFRYTNEILRLGGMLERAGTAEERRLLRRRLAWVQREWDRVGRLMQQKRRASVQDDAHQ